MTDYKLAYLREYESKNCDLRFTITIKTLNGELLEKEVIGFAKVTDTLADLKKNIQEKIFDLQYEGEKENVKQLSLDLPTTAKEIEVVFQKRNKSNRENQTLQNFIKNAVSNCIEEYVQILGQNFTILINLPMVRQLKLPLSIYANFTVELSKFTTFNTRRDTSKFIWSKSLDKLNWEKIAEGYQYKVKEADVDHYLKICCVPYSQHKIKGPSAEAISENKVELISDLPKCPFEKRHVLTKEKLSGNKFRVVSYNVLADRYVDGIQFSYCPPKAKGIHYRKQLVIKELKGYNPDIICLQEVDHSHYKEYYQEELKNMGFKCKYNKKGNCIPEGLLCAYNHRFKLLDFKHLVLRGAVERKQYSDLLDLLNLNENVKKEFLNQQTSLQVTVLQENKTKNILIVGNTHLYYHPDADHIRLLQVFMACTCLNNVKNRLMREYPKNKVTVIFCGDFNSDFKKSLYSFMIRGTINPEHEDCLKISPSRDARIYHRFHLESASGTPKYTNYTEDYKGCLDYIFTEKNKLLVNRVIPVPSETDLQKYRGLPNEFFPSDHLALVVDLEFSGK